MTLDTQEAERAPESVPAVLAKKGELPRWAPWAILVATLVVVGGLLAATGFSIGLWLVASAVVYAIATYAVSRGVEGRRKATDRLVTIVVTVAFLLALIPLVSVVVVVVVCLVATPLLSGLPLAALAAVVFLIGVELVDVAGMRRILAVRRAEFVVAVLTALAVVVLGVEVGILVAVVVSIIDHLRHSYAPRSTVLAKSPEGHWRSGPVTPGARTADGLLVYRFGSGLYFANVTRLVTDLTTIIDAGPPVRWLCLDAAAIGDVDYTAAAVLRRIVAREQKAGVRVVLSNVVDDVRAELDRYGITALIGADGVFDTSGEVLAAFETGG
jgi:MFS superfamily sulfate permease-like transporter